MATTDPELQPLILEAQRHLDADDYVSAARTFTTIHNRIPHAPMPLLSRATTYLQLDKNELARDDLLKVLGMPNVAIPPEIVPGCTSMHSAACMRLAKAYHELKQSDKAQQCFDRRTEIEKGNHKDSIHEPRQEAELLKEEGNRLFKQKQYVKAGALYKEAIDKDPSNPVLHSNIAQVLIHLKQLELAQFHAEACCQLDPEWAKGWYRLGTVYLKKLNYEAAHDCFLKAQKLNKSPDKTVEGGLKEAEKKLAEIKSRGAGTSDSKTGGGGGVNLQTGLWSLLLVVVLVAGGWLWTLGREVIMEAVGINALPW